MTKYYSENRASYFNEPGTVVQDRNNSNVKNAIDSFNEKIMDKKYTVKRPNAKVLGHVKKQD